VFVISLKDGADLGRILIGLSVFVSSTRNPTALEFPLQRIGYSIPVYMTELSPDILANKAIAMWSVFQYP
jgi:hypothetical protein